MNVKSQMGAEALPIELLQVFEMMNVTIQVNGEDVQVVDLVLQTQQRGQKPTTRRIRLRMELLIPFLADLQTVHVRAQGTIPPTH